MDRWNAVQLFRNTHRSQPQRVLHGRGTVSALKPHFPPCCKAAFCFAFARPNGTVHYSLTCLQTKGEGVPSSSLVCRTGHGRNRSGQKLGHGWQPRLHVPGTTRPGLGHDETDRQEVEVVHCGQALLCPVVCCGRNVQGVRGRGVGIDFVGSSCLGRHLPCSPRSWSRAEPSCGLFCLFWSGQAWAPSHADAAAAAGVDVELWMEGYGTDTCFIQ